MTKQALMSYLVTTTQDKQTITVIGMRTFLIYGTIGQNLDVKEHLEEKID